MDGRKTQDAGVVEPPETACIAVAGPVRQNRVVMTNRDWVIDGGEVNLISFWEGIILCTINTRYDMLPVHRSRFS